MNVSNQNSYLATLATLKQISDMNSLEKGNSSKNGEDILGVQEAFEETLTRGMSLNNRANGGNKVPYSAMAKNGVIEYNGVTFVCDPKKNALCLGDMSNANDVLIIPLSGGGSLHVNRDNLDGLSQAIGMFSAEDVKRILEAIVSDSKVKQTKYEIEENESKVTELNEEQEPDKL